MYKWEGGIWGFKGLSHHPNVCGPPKINRFLDNSVTVRFRPLHLPPKYDNYRILSRPSSPAVAIGRWMMKSSVNLLVLPSTRVDTFSSLSPARSLWPWVPRPCVKIYSAAQPASTETQFAHEKFLAGFVGHRGTGATTTDGQQQRRLWTTAHGKPFQPFVLI